METKDVWKYVLLFRAGTCLHSPGHNLGPLNSLSVEVSIALHRMKSTITANWALPYFCVVEHGRPNTLESPSPFLSDTQVDHTLAKFGSPHTASCDAHLAFLTRLPWSSSRYWIIWSYKWPDVFIRSADFIFFPFRMIKYDRCMKKTKFVLTTEPYRTVRYMSSLLSLSSIYYCSPFQLPSDWTAPESPCIPLDFSTFRNLTSEHMLQLNLYSASRSFSNSPLFAKTLFRFKKQNPGIQLRRFRSEMSQNVLR